MHPYLRSLTLALTCLVSTQVFAQETVTRKVLNNTIEISMPQVLKADSARTTDITEAFATENQQVVMDFTITEMAVPEDFVPQMGKQVEQQMQAQYGAKKVLTSETIKVNDKSIYTSAFIANDDQYLRMILFTAKGKFMVCAFKCKSEIREEWEKRSDAMARSIKDVKP